jgi:hypothetical protein
MTLGEDELLGVVPNRLESSTGPKTIAPQIISATRCLFIRPWPQNTRRPKIKSISDADAKHILKPDLIHRSDATAREI